MSISDDDINSQPADDGLPPVIAGDSDEPDEGSDATDVDDADSGD